MIYGVAYETYIREPGWYRDEAEVEAEQDFRTRQSELYGDGDDDD